MYCYIFLARLGKQCYLALQRWHALASCHSLLLPEPRAHSRTLSLYSMHRTQELPDHAHLPPPGTSPIPQCCTSWNRLSLAAKGGPTARNVELQWVVETHS